MREEKHTPGPWSYRNQPHDDWGIVRAGRYIICQAKDPRVYSEEDLAAHRAAKTDPWEANARAISAVPELIAVAEMVVEASDLSGVTGPLGDAARAALAKALTQETQAGDVA